MQLAERFWSKVLKRDGADACWLWTGGLGESGHGLFWYEGGMKNAHRISYMLEYGPIPEGFQVLHIRSCPNPNCVRPTHLYLGGNSENMIDKYRVYGGHKITKAQADAIRVLYSLGRTQTDLAREFSVSQALISLIVRDEYWFAE